MDELDGILLDDYPENSYVPSREQWREEFLEYIEEYDDGNMQLDE